ncbi:hypothetical protein U27_03779 [Candidatus Vecturithrix granuli]|uniref:Uncharacterized protein n=1 Tax=Vecturithrix granuli TaxID=1499967 RepID=A0A081BWW0_VECG1|nr:hypothetical protein U27_03779 [Candidatus Vecturithrix granuli]
MKIKKPLLIPEPCEVLAAGESKTLQDFCESGHLIFYRQWISTRVGNTVGVPIQILPLPGRVVVESPDIPADPNRGQSRNPRDRRVAP